MQAANTRHGMLELVLVEARDLIAADLCGTSDPFIIVQYGKQRKRTKVCRHLSLVYVNGSNPFVYVPSKLTSTASRLL